MQGKRREAQANGKEHKETESNGNCISGVPSQAFYHDTEYDIICRHLLPTSVAVHRCRRPSLCLWLTPISPHRGILPCMGCRKSKSGLAISSANTQTRTSALPRGGIYVKTAGKRETPGKADIRNPLREDTANALLRAGDSLRVKE